MTKLANCLLRQAKDFKNFDESEVVEASKIYQSRGKSEDAANILAIEDHLRDLRTQRSEIAASVVAAFKAKDPAKYAEIEAANRPAAPKQADAEDIGKMFDDAVDEVFGAAPSERDAAMAELGQGIDELISLMGGKANMLPEEEARLIPIMSKIFRAAAKLGYLTFKDAGRFVLSEIRGKSREVADKLSIENLQAGYINAIPSMIREQESRAAQSLGTDTNASIETKALKVGSDGFVANAKPLSDLYATHPEIEESFSGLDIETRRRVVAVVFGALHDNKILNAVIPLVPVDVVDVLTGQKGAADVLLNHEAMLRRELTANPLAFVGVRVLPRLISALRAAENSVYDVGVSPQDGSSTDRTGGGLDVSTPGNAAAAITAKSPGLAGGMPEAGSANLANGLHSSPSTINQHGARVQDENTVVNDIRQLKRAALDFDSIEQLMADDAKISEAIDSAAHEAATSPLNDKPQPTGGQKAANNYAVGSIPASATAIGMPISIENPKDSIRWKLDTDRLKAIAQSIIDNRHNSAESRQPALAMLDALAEITGADVTKVEGGFDRLQTAIDGLIRNFPVQQEAAQDIFDAGWKTKMQQHYGYIKGTTGRDKDHIDIFLAPGADTATKVWVIDQKNPDGSFDEHKVVLGPETESEARAAYLANYQPGWTGIGAITSMPVPAFKAWAGDGKIKRNPLAYVEAQTPQKTAPAPESAEFKPGDRIEWDVDGTAATGTIIGRLKDAAGFAPAYEVEVESHPTQGKYSRAAAPVASARRAGETATTEDSKSVAALLIDADFPISLEDARADKMAVEAAEAVERKNQAEAKSEKELYGPRKVGTRAVTYNNIRFNLEYTARSPDGTRETEYWIGDETTGARSAQYTLHDGWKTPSEIVAMLQETKDPDAQWWSELIISGVLNPSKPTQSEKVVEGEVDTDRHENATAPEHIKDDTGVTVAELKQIAKAFRDAVDSGDSAEVTRIFDAPTKSEIVRLKTKADAEVARSGWLTPAQAKARVQEWRDHAAAQYDNDDIRSANSQKIVISLFDLTGKWSQPWEEAGYQVYRFDIQNGDEAEHNGEVINIGDINNFSTDFFNDIFGSFDGLDVHAILAACPCTDFANSGAKHFAAKDADGRTVASIKLVKATLATIEYFKPSIWALENPTGRIESLTGLPPWRLSFDPYQLGDDYTKKTLIWGRFNADLPIAPAEPTEGSKMWSKYGGKSQATKNARSATPEGFAYGFFMANNAADNPVLAIAGKYDRLDRGAIKAALDAGATTAQIDEAVQDFYYMDLDDEAANEALRDLAKGAGGEPDAIEPSSATGEGEKWPKPNAYGVYSEGDANRQSFTGSKDVSADVFTLEIAPDKWVGSSQYTHHKGSYASSTTGINDGKPFLTEAEAVAFWAGKVSRAQDDIIESQSGVTSQAQKKAAKQLKEWADDIVAGAGVTAGAPKADDGHWLHDEIVNLIHFKGRTQNRRALDKIVDLLKRRAAGEDVRNGKVKSHISGFKNEAALTEILNRIVNRLEVEDKAVTSAKRKETAQAKKETAENGNETDQAQQGQPETPQQGATARRVRFISRGRTDGERFAEAITEFKDITIPELPGRNFFVHAGDNGQTVITERETGKAMARGDTPKLADKALMDVLKARPAADIEKIIAGTAPLTIDLQNAALAALEQRETDQKVADDQAADAATASAGWDMKPSYGDKVDSQMREGDIGAKKNKPYASRAAAVGWIFKNKASDTHEVFQVGKSDFVLRPIAGSQTAAEKKAEFTHKAAVKAAEVDAFNAMVASQELINAEANTPGNFMVAAQSAIVKWIGSEMLAAANAGEMARVKALDSLLKDGKPVLPESFFESARDAIKKQAKLAKLEGVKAASRLAAVEAIAKANVLGDQGKVMFLEGWDHALAGKTKSTLSSDDLHQNGYEAARVWMKTPDGSAAFTGKRAKKLENTGVDLRRWFDEQKAKIDTATDTDSVISAIDAATTRAELFRSVLDEGATPGAQRWLEGLRNQVYPFKRWLTERGPLGHRYGRYYSRRTSDTEIIRGYLEGEVYQPKQENDTKEQRIAVLKSAAEEYVDLVRDITENIQGKTVTELAQSFEALMLRQDIEADMYKTGDYSPTGTRILPMFFKGKRAIATFAMFKKGPSYQLRKLIENEARTDESTRKAALTPPRLDRVERDGEDFRGGQNVSPESFKRTFNFADVGFGKWVGAKQDQDHLNYSFDAFGDLAKLIGIPPAAISLGGRLHFTIGALGHGKFAAHYAQNQPHPDGGTVPVINVTNTRGDGTVAHEWSHALDLTPQDDSAGSPRSLRLAIDEIKRDLKYAYNFDTLRASVVQHLKGERWWRGDKRAVNTDDGKIDNARRAIDYYSQPSRQMSAYYRAAMKLDGSKGGKKDAYWSNDKELFARAFEGWVGDALETSNTYLVNPEWSGEGMITEKTHRGTPYPVGAERERIAEWMDALRKSLVYDDQNKILMLDPHEWSRNKPNHAEEWTKALQDLRAEIPAMLEAVKREQQFGEEAAKAAKEHAASFKAGDWVRPRDGRETRLREKIGNDPVAIDSIRASGDGTVYVLVAGYDYNVPGVNLELVQTKEQHEAQIAKARAEEVTAPSPAAEPVGELSADDIEAAFNEAAAELAESTQEQPEAPAPGEAVSKLADAWTDDDIAYLRKKVEDGQIILLASGELGLPTIHDMPSDKTHHMGFGVFRTSTPYWEGTWEAGGAMQHTPGGHAFTTVSMTRGEIDPAIFDKSGVLNLLQTRDENKQKAANLLSGRGGRIETDAEKTARTTLDEQADKTAAGLAAEAAKLGVKGIDEAMKGLVKLFGGGPGKLQSFPAGMDEDSYKQAKPHFEAALKAFQDAGKTIKDLFKFLIEQFGMGIKPYALHFAKEMQLSADLGQSVSANRKVANFVLERLSAGADIRWQDLFAAADKAFGGTQAAGTYTVKDAYDAMEMGVNLYLEKGNWTAAGKTAEAAQRDIRNLGRMIAQLPTQTKRTAEMDEFQQFSTPPTLAYAANWVANIRPGETMMEPSAGTGDLAIFAHNAGASLILNELSSRRAAILKELFPRARVFTENAEQLNNVLPADALPTVAVMNPPFSSTAGRKQGSRDTMNGARHIEQALKRLDKGGRLVAIVGEGMAADRPAFKEWWKKIAAEYNVRANIGISGKEYAKYGTTFDNNILVIDKNGPTINTVVTGKVETVAELPALLEGIRNDRPQASAAINGPESVADQQEGDGTSADGGAGVVAADGTGSNAPDAVGAGKRPSSTRPGRPGNADSSNAAGAGNAVADDDGQRGRARSEPAGGADGSGGAAAGGTDGVAPGATGVTLGAAEKQQQGELTDSVFENYRPQRLEIKGAHEHPGKLVQSAAMAAVEPPAPTYTPNLPAEVIAKGMLSNAQLESVVYAGQAHQQFLPNGERRGILIGDGTGVGKGREISGIILDNMRQGRNKAVWVSANEGLMTDAGRDFSGVGGDPGLIFFQGKTKAGGDITAKKGILFTTYPTLRGGEKKQATDTGGKQGKRRIDQLVKWLGEDFDGVIVFDEAHAMGNVVETKGKRGKKKASAQALAGVNLQKQLPKARIVYVSATGATEVNNLGYGARLGLWGEGTAFPGVKEFVGKIIQGGVAAMELISRDMKALGMYISRSLSFDGVTYERLDHDLTPLQTDIYNELAKTWQIVLQNVDAALVLTNQAKDGNAKSAAMSRFWGTHQRFFNQVITSMQTPTVIEDMRKQIEAGNAVLIQLVNTNEAEQERQAARAQADGVELEELDFTPRQALMDYVRNAFPVQAYQESSDADGNTVYVPVMDAAGNPVFDQDAIKLRDELLSNLEAIRVPENPIDAIINAFGSDKVGEVTGRGRRFVQTRDEDGNLKIVEEKRGKHAAQNDAVAFQSDKKPILIFSQAGGTGFSFHADNTAKNKRKRIHYILQPGWRADSAVQGFGRSHRTNQAQPPHYVLPTTNLKAQKRFVSSIARRLDQLGALTRGQRQATSQGLFTASDNLESKYADDALEVFFQDMYRGSTPLVFSEVTRAMGLNNLIDPKTGSLSTTNLPEIPRFLNRLLSLSSTMQDEVFGEFEKRLEEIVNFAIQQGTYDNGMQTLKAESVKKVRDDVAYTDERTGAETRYVEIDVTNPIKYRSFENAENWSKSHGDKFVGWFKNAKGDVFGISDLGDRVNADGEVHRRGAVIDIRDHRLRYVDNLKDIKQGWAWGLQNGRSVKKTISTPVEASAIKDEWEKQVAEAPKHETRREHMIVGVILPVWDRVEGHPRIYRLQTDDGERMIGRVMGPKDAAKTLKNLGLGSSVSKMAPTELLAAIKRGARAILGNGWEISTAGVSGDTRIEIKTPSGYLSGGEQSILKDQGVFFERISFRERAFIPTGADELKTFERVVKAKPVVDLFEAGQKDAAESPTMGYNDPYEHLETRPGTNEEQRRTGRDAARSVERAVFGGAVDRVRGGGPTILGLAISRDFREDGGTSFTGKQVSNPRDLALLAQIVRDPRFETVRIFYTKGDAIVGQTAFSSRLPSVVYLGSDFQQNVIAGKTRFDADGYWIVHNHPNGASTPSKTDERLTADLSDNVPGFKGHVVIDHNEYSVISRGEYNSIGVRTFIDPSLGSTDLLANPVVPNQFLGATLAAPVAVKDMARAMQVKDGFVVIVGVDSLNKVRVITELLDVAAKAMSRGEGLRNINLLRKMRESAGLYRLFAIVPGNYTEARYHDLLNSRLFTDVVGSNGAAAERGAGNLSGTIPQSAADLKRGGTPWFVEEPAYHGTPHEVDRFSTDKIGTGEGAQSFGWGLYFSSAKDIAKWYRDKLSHRSFNGTDLNKLPWFYDAIARKIDQGESFADAKADAVAILEQQIEAHKVDLAAGKSWATPEKIAQTEKSLAEINALTRESYRKESGRLYSVELAPEPDEYLLWDKPLSEQSEKVKDALRSDPVLQHYLWVPGLNGSHLYRELWKMNGGDGRGKRSMREASEHLHQLSIRGIKYLDGTSRNKTHIFIDGKQATGKIDDLAGQYILNWGNRPARIEIEMKANRDVKAADRPAIMARVNELLASGAKVTQESTGTHNYVIFDENDVTITGMESRAGNAGVTAEIYASNFIAHGQAMRDTLDIEDGVTVSFGDLPGVIQDEVERQAGRRIHDGEILTVRQPTGGEVRVLIDVPGAAESRGPADFTGHTADEIRDGLIESFGGRAIRQLEANGRIKIMENAEEFAALFPGVAVSKSAKAVFIGDRAYFFANRMRPQSARIELLHEIGEHYGLERLLGEAGYSNLIQSVKDMRDNGDIHAARAWDFVARNYPEETEGSRRFMHEVLAQLGQNADIQARPWWKSVIEAVKRFLVKMGFTGMVKVADIQDMVLHSLKVAANEPSGGPGGGIRGSQIANTAMASNKGDSLGVWSQNADRLVPRGPVSWVKGPLGFSGSINGKPVASIRTGGSGAWTARIEGWQWNVTPDMAADRFNKIPGDKIKVSPVKGFKSAAAAKSELEKILSHGFMSGVAPGFGPVDTNSPEFKRWFGDSKVVDAEGKPLRVYHGTPHDFSRFKLSKNGIFGRGIYLTTDTNDAEGFAYGGDTNGDNIMPLYAAITRPYKIDFRDTWPDLYRDLTGDEPANTDKEYPSREQEKRIHDALIRMGHDGIEVYGAGDHATSTFYIALDKTQVKSAISNTGEFDPANPNILESRAGYGREAFAANVLQELATEDALFRYPVSQAGSLRTVFADVFPGVEWHGETTSASEKADTGAEQRFTLKTPDTPAMNGKPEVLGKQFDVYMTRDRVWLDVHRSMPGEQGSRIYAAVANFAYNTRRVFGGDPAGVSVDAVMARTKMMLASALRFGTTRHLDASSEQEKGIPEGKIEPLDWSGNDIDKLRALIHTFIVTVQNNAPAIKDFRYDFKLRRFVKDGSDVAGAASGIAGISSLDSDTAFAALGDAVGEDQRRAARIGADSGRAAILIQSLIRGESQTLGDDGILQAALNHSGSLVSEDGGLGAMFSKGNYLDDDLGGVADTLRNFPRDRATAGQRSPDKWFKPVLDGVLSSFKGSSNFGALDRSIHTQLHKAQKNRHFGETFKRVQHFMEDASRAALRPAELAPTVLPRIDAAENIAGALKALLKGKEASADIDAAFGAALAGTLDDKVFKTAEDASLTPEQFSVYREIRDAADASLDELSAAEAWGIARPLFLDVTGKLTRAGLQMKKALLASPGQSKPILLDRLITDLEDAKLRFQQLTEVAREKAPFVTGGAVDNLRAAMQSGIGNAEQNAAIAAAMESAAEVKALDDTVEKVAQLLNRRDQLQREGYVPLMRFGQHYLTISRIDPTTGEIEVDENGDKVVEYFGLFESEAERDKAAKALRELYPDDSGADFDTGTLSEEEWQRYKGVSPETVALFAGKLGIGNDEVFQEWYRLAASNRSTLKRLIHRKGTPGFSEDGARVLASFLTSNGRRASMLYHMADIQESIDDFPRQQGAEKDEAIRMVEYIQNPDEEAATPRALLFMHFLGGTVSNFLINATQPAMVTLPYVAQFVGMKRATALMKDAYAIRNKPEAMSQELRDALSRADQEGKVGAQEIHHLWQETARPLANSLGRFGDAATYRAHAFMSLWGMPFAIAEHMNRQVTFITAYNATKEQGSTADQAYSKAIQAIDETQFIYGKNNRPNWARGNIGAVVFTFKLFAISYTELLVRMLRQNPESRKAALYMLGMLILASGLQGLPGSDDLDDLIDTIAQALGYNVNSRLAKRKWIEGIAGKTAASFAMHGLSALTPLDVSGRMSLGNLIPGTGLFKASNSRKEADLLEIVGPVGGLAMSYINTWDAAATGNWSRAATEWMPKALKDAVRGGEMLVTGEALDQRGRKVVDVSPLEAVVKAAGFNPQAIAEVGRNTRDVQQKISFARRTENLIAEQWARGIVDGKPGDIADARDAIAEWNATNPETPISVKYSAVAKRAAAMRANKSDRFIKSATKEMRDFAAEGIE